MVFTLTCYSFCCRSRWSRYSVVFTMTGTTPDFLCWRRLLGCRILVGCLRSVCLLAIASRPLRNFSVDFCHINWVLVFYVCLVVNSIYIGASLVRDLRLVEEGWLYKGSLCWKLERVPPPLDHGGTSQSFLHTSKISCVRGGLPSFCSLRLHKSVFHTVIRWGHYFKWIHPTYHSILGPYQELGGNALFFDRFLARFLAFFYYFMTVGMYMLSPRMACRYSFPIMKWKPVFYLPWSLWW